LKPDDLVGTWRLRSWKNKASDGSVVDPLTLSTKPMSFQGMERTAELVWERVGAS
jgi:hypothetical protein